MSKSQSMEAHKFRFSLKEILVIIICTALALGSLKSEDPWVVIPMLLIAGIASVGLCLYHRGSVPARVSIGFIIVLVLVFIGWRDLRKPVGVVATYAAQPVSLSQSPPNQIQTGPITASDCSGVQVGGSQNNQTINCGSQMPPRRILSAAKQTSLVDALKKNVGIVQIVPFSNDDREDVSNLATQLNQAFQQAGWTILPTPDGGDANNVVISTATGPKRLGGESFVCAPDNRQQPSGAAQLVISVLKTAGIPCIVDPDFSAPYGRAAFMAYARGLHPDITILISKRVVK